MQTNNKLREALETLVDVVDAWKDHLPSAIREGEVSAALEKANAALASPPRNCDVYDNESCRMAYHLHGDGLMTMQAFADWLFAPATEKEGGAK